MALYLSKIFLLSLPRSSIRVLPQICRNRFQKKGLSVLISRNYAAYGLINEASSVETSSQITPTEIKTFLRKNNLNFSIGYTCFSIVKCPFCLFHHNTKVGTLFINFNTGWFKCDSCLHHGEWSNLVENINQLKKKSDCHLKLKSREVYNHGELLKEYVKSQDVKLLCDGEFETICKKFDLHGIKADTLSSIGLKYNSEGSFIIPMYNEVDEIISLKKFSSITKSNAAVITEPKNSNDACFGLHPNFITAKEIIVTDHPLDMAAIKQEVKDVPCVALPSGSSFLSQQLLPFFEKFNHIIFWFSDNQMSWEAIKSFSRKLGVKRCSFIRIKASQPSAKKALAKGYDFSKILKARESLEHDSITCFETLRKDVYREIVHADSVAGVKWQRFPRLNEILKGHRRGELTIFTGPTGAGKTTFLSEYSLDLCMQGVNTLWGSFEIQNVRLAKTMLTQYSSLNFKENIDKFDYWADKFENLPLYFMKFHGKQSLNNVIKTMSYAVYVNDIQHIIVDNLQFMMGVDNFNIDRFHQQDLIISAFRKFATSENCHVTLVIHPRKEKDTEFLSTSSIFGSAKATQESDNVIILQNKINSPKKLIQITKNRFDGTLGIMPVEFDKPTLRFMNLVSEY